MSAKGKPRSATPLGVRILGSGAALPKRAVTNADLEQVMDTSDEWIVQRTGIHTRHVHDRNKGETTGALASSALRGALASAGVEPGEIDLIVTATMTPEMPTPSVSCVVGDQVGCGHAGAVDLNGACCGFVFALNFAHEYIRGGQARTVAVIGADTITQFVEFSTWGRGSAILFGDGAAALILRADPDSSLGVIAQAIHADGSRACNLYIPRHEHDFYEKSDYEPRAVSRLHMNGQAVFKFAVLKFPQVIEETLQKAGLEPNDVDVYICHQANTRILESARERFGLSPDRLPINIDRYGNTVAASAPLLFHELRSEGRIKPGQKVMFLAFGAGLTWGSSLWQF
jgi:3-oxoacyl-[acyl-carrier-protein] synthase-3